MLNLDFSKELEMNELHTGDSFNVGNIEIPTSGQRSEERGYICGALEAFTGLLVALPVVDLQVHNRPMRRNGWNYRQATLLSTKFQ